MKRAGGLLLTVTVSGICLLAAAHNGFAASHGRGEGTHPKVITDGRLRPGHRETIRVKGFPGKGVTEVAFFPTAICEDLCSGRSFRGGRTNSKGEAEFRVHVPGTFIDHRNRSAYFRDGERIEVDVTWEGPDHTFDGATADPEPIIVRVHGSHRG